MYKCQLILAICTIDYDTGETYVLTQDSKNFELPNIYLESSVDEDLSALFYDTLGYSMDWIHLKPVKVVSEQNLVKIIYFGKIPKTDNNKLWVKTSVASIIDPTLREIFLHV